MKNSNTDPTGQLPELPEQNDLSKSLMPLLSGGSGAMRRTGKIATLPSAIRVWVNEALVDGLTYKDVCAGLETRGYPGYSLSGIARWFQGGHQDWLLELERREALRLRVDSAFALARDFKDADKASLNSSNEMLLLSQINDLLQSYDPHRLKEVMEDKPEQFFRLANTVNAQANERRRGEKLKLELQKYKHQVAEQKRKLADLEDQNKPQGLTPETLAKIEEAARLL